MCVSISVFFKFCSTFNQFSGGGGGDFILGTGFPHGGMTFANCSMLEEQASFGCSLMGAN